VTEPLLKARDVADLLGLEVATVVDHAQRGDLPGFRLYGRKGGPLRFRRDEIEQWLESRCRLANVGDDNVSGPATPKRPGPDIEEVPPDARRILRFRE
jgi:excisionase family DNA binding protein